MAQNNIASHVMVDAADVVLEIGHDLQKKKEAPPVVFNAQTARITKKTAPTQSLKSARGFLNAGGTGKNKEM